MERIAKFEKVSEDRFVADYLDTFPEATREEATKIYGEINIPVRATKGSAGYDIHTTAECTLEPGESIKIPTGIRCRIREDYVLMLFPRSGLGFKYRLQLDNSVGVIDSDYYFSSNEGHIFVKITNDSRTGKTVVLKRGDRFAQGVFLQYGITEDDEADGVRDGGFNSTGS
ncbi:MAG: dUTP diphosphatase [Lachnospiraceae bacterium]|nr:dUTP diphosphatase [Lachnospiraceae bacterium]